jgi:hypothetical protein
MKPGDSIVFTQLQEVCPFKRRVPTEAGPCFTDCGHAMHHHSPECCASVCPCFISDDPHGDYEDMRDPHEIEGIFSGYEQ